MIATAALPDVVTIQSSVSSGLGPQWSTRASGVPGRLVHARRSLRDDTGSKRTSSARLTVRPDVVLLVGDRIIAADDATYTVLAVRTAVELRRPWALLADLEGPR